MFSIHTCPLASQEGKETGGMNVYVFELARKLVGLGYVVDIFTRYQSHKDPKIATVIPGLRVIHLKAGPEKSIPKKLVINHLDEFTQSFLSFIKVEQKTYNLLHAHYYLSGIVCQRVKAEKLPNIPLVVTFHTLALMKNLVARDELEKEEKERIDAELSLVRKADIIIAPSKTDSKYLQYLYDCSPLKISVITPGVNTSLFKPIDKNAAKKYIHADLDHKLILFVGRIEPLKAIDVLLYAMKILSKQNPSLTTCLWIVGGDVTQKKHLWSKELQKLEKLRILLNITTAVTFVGQKPQRKLPYYYNAAQLVIMPSHYESFGMAALEAMACGTPVITTNVSGIESIIDEDRKTLITSSNNPLLLAKKMAFLLTNKTEYEKISQNVQETAQNLDWENTAKKVSSIYKKLL